jgi:hypothetical protein
VEQRGLVAATTVPVPHRQELQLVEFLQQTTLQRCKGPHIGVLRRGRAAAAAAGSARGSPATACAGSAAAGCLPLHDRNNVNHSRWLHGAPPRRFNTVMIARIVQLLYMLQRNCRRRHKPQGWIPAHTPRWKRKCTSMYWPRGVAPHPGPQCGPCGKGVYACVQQQHCTTGTHKPCCYCVGYCGCQCRSRSLASTPTRLPSRGPSCHMSVLSHAAVFTGSAA